MLEVFDRKKRKLRYGYAGSLLHHDFQIIYIMIYDYWSVMTINAHEETLIFESMSQFAVYFPFIKSGDKMSVIKNDPFY